MDLVSRKMISSVKEIKQTMKQKDFDYEIYMDLSVPTSTEIKAKLISLLWLYNRMKKDFYLNSSHEDVFFIVEHIKNKAFEISSDLTELTNCAVELFYGEKKSNHDFVWQIFSDGIIYNMLKKYKTFKLPIQARTGDFTFLGREYVMKELSIGAEKSEETYSR